MLKVKIKKLSNANDLELPNYATSGSAATDLRAAVSEEVVIAPMQRKLIPIGISIALPSGYEAQIRPRSGLALKNGITVLNTPGTIDTDYRGEICVILINLGNEEFKISRGMRVAQMLISKVEQVDFVETEVLEDTVRSSGGFGSSGL